MNDHLDPTPMPSTPSGISPRRGCSQLLFKWTVYAAFMYLFLVGFIALNETNLVYPGSKFPRGNWNPDFDFEEVTFISKDGTKLLGWYLPSPGATENVLICHGNAENVAQTAASYGRKFQARLNANVFIVDYRGFGKSEGEPFEQGVLEDAEAAMDWLAKKSDCQYEDIILVGHSLGGGPVVHLASTKGAKSMFLQRTFASLVEPAAGQYWFIPVNLIMRNRFPSVQRISDCTVPLHQSHGAIDSLVPVESGRKLFDASPTKLKKFFEVSGGGHWDPLPQNYWHDVVNFQAKVNRQTRHAQPPKQDESKSGSEADTGETEAASKDSQIKPSQ